MNRRLIPFSFLMILAFLQISCDGSRKGKDSEPSYGKVESALRSSSAENQLPYRFVLAVAYMESGINAQKSSSIYVNRLDQYDQRERSVMVGQTAFGVSRAKLGLANDETSDSLDVQAKAYGKFLSEQIKAKKELVADPQTIEQKVRYIWELAKIHRPGSDALKDLRLVFAKELIAILNQGFEVQIPESGEIVTLEKEPVEINETNIPADMQKTFRLGSVRGEIRPAVLFSLSSPTPSNIVNQPKGVTVIHCPFSLSACLDMQIQKTDEETRLGAHYIIPPNPDLVPPGILQVALHKEAVPRLNDQGELDYIQDSIVVMVVGSSGRVVKGVRNPAQPEWLTDKQLQLMGTAISLICDAIADTHGVDANVCKTVESAETPQTAGSKSVVFKYQRGDSYSWGDIPDYDESIFVPYIAANGGLSGDTKFEFDNKDRRFNAGDIVGFNLAFQPKARKVEIERLVRCRSAEGRVVWESKFSKEVRRESKGRFEMQFFDAGPNGNGDQFLRAKILGDDDVFLGWAIERLNIRGYEKGDSSVNGKSCSKTGS